MDRLEKLQSFIQLTLSGLYWLEGQNENGFAWNVELEIFRCDLYVKMYTVGLKGILYIFIYHFFYNLLQNGNVLVYSI